ncbi:NnrU family protein [Dinoroseobacter sp. S375]|uniref:NnrU family protein n=1 Tax=Dinoroseobacter sp. S375 TaxID=3415136 RepID=UPI003C7D979D
MGWTELGVAFAVFLLSHAIPVRPPVKPWLVARLGQGGFTILYSMLSLAVLVWVIGAAGRAPVVPLWPQMPILQGGAMVGMLVVCLGVALSIGVPNPFSFGGGDPARYDPKAPGVIRLTRHPLLLGLALWGVVHVLANGDLAHVLLFGLFAGFAGLGTRILDRRRQREMGPQWAELDVQRRSAPLSLGGFGPLTLRLLAGLGLFLLLWALHGPVIDVVPML